jgi:hypothetical protein
MLWEDFCKQSSSLTQLMIGMPPRRFPPLWSAERQKACLVVRDHSGALAYIYFEDESGRRSAANLVTKDEARRIAGHVCNASVSKLRGHCGVIRARGKCNFYSGGTEMIRQTLITLTAVAALGVGSAAVAVHGGGGGGHGGGGGVRIFGFFGNKYSPYPLRTENVALFSLNFVALNLQTLLEKHSMISWLLSLHRGE